MTQQINLFNPIFRKQRIVFTLSRVVICAVVGALAMTGVWYYQHRVVKGLKEELQSAQSLLKAQREHVDKMTKGQAAVSGQPSQFDLETARLERELKHGRDEIAAIEGGISGGMRGFSEYLGAFSRQTLNGLWLTGLVISGDGNITIRGRALNPELLPDYIQRLNREQVLQGRNFSALELHQAAQGPGAPGKAKPAERLPRFLEFSLATAESASPTTGGSRNP